MPTATITATVLLHRDLHTHPGPAPDGHSRARASAGSPPALCETMFRAVRRRTAAAAGAAREIITIRSTNLKPLFQVFLSESRASGPGLGIISGASSSVRAVCVHRAGPFPPPRPGSPCESSSLHPQPPRQVRPSGTRRAADWDARVTTRAGGPGLRRSDPGGVRAGLADGLRRPLLPSRSCRVASSESLRPSRRGFRRRAWRPPRRWRRGRRRAAAGRQRRRGPPGRGASWTSSRLRSAGRSGRGASSSTRASRRVNASADGSTCVWVRADSHLQHETMSAPC